MFRSVLDFGCGDGVRNEISEDRTHIYHWLERYGGCHAVGLDVNQHAIDNIRQRINNGTEYCISDNNTIPYPDQAFNLIHEHGVFHHMADYGAAVREIHRVLRSDGLLIVKETVSNDRVYHLARLIARQWRGDEIQSYFTTSELIQVLKPYFRIISIEYYWRCVLSDILLDSDMENGVSLRFNVLVNNLFKFIGIDKYTACHCVIKARRL